MQHALLRTPQAYVLAAEAVEAAGKDMYDRKEVLGEGLVRRGVDVVENHEFAVVRIVELGCNAIVHEGG